MATIQRVRDRKDPSRTIAWRVKWREADGRQRSKQFKRQTDARTWLDKTNLNRVRTATAPTVGELFDRWTATRRVSRARESTERSLSKHLGPLASRRVDKIERSDILAWISDLTDQGLSATTVGDCVGILRGVITLAVGDRVIEHNPIATVPTPKRTRAALDARDVLTGEEMTLLLPLVPNRWRALVALLGFVGPRWSEGLAVTPRDLDLLHRSIHVGHQVIEEVNGHRRQRDGGKTRGSDRFVPLPSVVADHLERHISQYPAGVSQLLFRTESGNSPSRSNFRQRTWRPAMDALGQLLIDRAGTDPAALLAAEQRAAELRVIPPGHLRHTAASLMLAHRLPILDVATRLGHARPSMTLDRYARLLPSDQDQIDPHDAALTALSKTSGRNPASGVGVRNICGTTAGNEGSRGVTTGHHEPRPD